jgi:hypothetical protein
MGIEIDLELSNVFSVHLKGERTGEVVWGWDEVRSGDVASTTLASED